MKGRYFGRIRDRCERCLETTTARVTERATGTANNVSE
jgi:hypothetical protein